MPSLIELIKNYSLKHNNKIARVIEPLKQVSGIHGFFYYTISTTGLFTFMGTQPSWVEEYYEEKYYLHNPFLCHPSALHKGIYFPNMVRDEQYLEMLNIRRKKIDVDHSMIMINKNQEEMEAFGFYTSCDNPQIYNFYANEQALLQLFIEYFKKEMEKELLSMKRDPADLFAAKKKLFFPKENQIILSPTIRRDFLKTMKKDTDWLWSLKITPREKDILSLLKMGRTAEEIAKNFSISRRTVEKYIEHLKFKLQCEKRSEILDRLAELEKCRMI